LFPKGGGKRTPVKRAWAGMAAALKRCCCWLGGPALAVLRRNVRRIKLWRASRISEVQTVCATVMVLAEIDIANARRTLEAVIEAHPHFVPARIAAPRTACCRRAVCRKRAGGGDCHCRRPGESSALYVLSLVQCAEHRFGKRADAGSDSQYNPDYPPAGFRWLRCIAHGQRPGGSRRVPAL